jgi:hypothetical protein
MIPTVEKRKISMKERKKQSDSKIESAEVEQSRRHRRFLPLMSDTFYNCELCGVGIAIIRIVTAGNIEGQSKVCRSCLQEYINEQAKK